MEQSLWDEFLDRTGTERIKMLQFNFGVVGVLQAYTKWLADRPIKEVSRRLEGM